MYCSKEESISLWDVTDWRSRVTPTWRLSAGWSSSDLSLILSNTRSRKRQVSWVTWPGCNRAASCPQCDLGEHCAVRKGSRIGKMCDCPRGAFCNFFLLKCLWANQIARRHFDLTRWVQRPTCEVEMRNKPSWTFMNLREDSFVVSVALKLFFFSDSLLSDT